MTPTLNGSPITTCTLRLPRVGEWKARLTLDAATPPLGAAELALLGETYRGTITESGSEYGRITVRVVGGKGQLDAQPAPLAWRGGVSVRQLLQDALGQAGEALSPTAGPELSQQLQRWTRVRRPLRQELARLADLVHGVWRVLPSGSVWAGRETWPQGTCDEWDRVEDAHAERLLIISAPVCALQPGQVFEGRRLSAVEHQVDAGAARTLLFYESTTAETGEDRTRAAIVQIVEQVIHRWNLDFLAPQAGSLFAQDADGTLQVQLDDPDWPPLVGVQLAQPAGYQAALQPGARVAVQFLGGSPDAPVAWILSGAAREVRVDAPQVKVGAGAALVALGPTACAGAGKTVAATGDPVVGGSAVGTTLNQIVKV